MMTPRPYRLTAIGLILVVVDPRVAVGGFEFDVASDVVGYVLICRAMRVLAPIELAFRVVFWSAAIMAVFGLRGQLISNPTLLSREGMGQLAANLPYLFIRLAEVGVGVVGLVSLATGVGLEANRQSAFKLARRAHSARRLIVVVTGLWLVWTAGSISSYSETELVRWAFGVVVFTVLHFLWVLWLADRQMPVLPETEPRGALPGATIPAAVMVGVLAVYSVVYSPAEYVGFGPEYLLEAASIQPAGIQEPPLLQNYNRHEQRFGQVCIAVPWSVSAIDVGTGDTRWRRPAPERDVWNQQYLAYPGLADQTFVDPYVGWRLPSVTVWDPTSNQDQWRYYFAAESIAVRRLADGALLVSQRDLLDADAPPYLVLDQDGNVIAEYHIEPALDYHHVSDRQVVDAELDLFDDVFEHFGNHVSVGEGIQWNDNTIMALLGSSRGPNSRLVVIDRLTGDELWRLEPVRSAAVAGERIIYDVRNDQPADAVSTRDLHVVSINDPEVVYWSTRLAVGDEGGNGFLGEVPAGLVFAVQDGETGLEFLVISDASDVPAIIHAADGLGGGPGDTHHIDDEVFAAVTEGGLAFKSGSQPTKLISFDRPLQHVERIGDLIVVTEPGGECV